MRVRGDQAWEEREPARVELEKRANYTITDWQRTCSLIVSWQSRGQAMGGDSGTLDRITRHTDSTTPARARIRLREDPLDFGPSESEVLGAADQEIRQALLAKLGETVRAEARARRQARYSTLDQATRAMVVADVMDPSDALGAFLDAKHDLPAVR